MKIEMKEGPSRSPQQSLGEEEKQLDLWTLLGLFVDKKWVIISTTSLCFVVGLVFWSLIPNQYLGKTQLMFLTPSRELFTDASGYGNLMVTPAKTGEFYNTFVELVKGPMILNRAAARLKAEGGARDWKLFQNEDRVVGKLQKAVKAERIPGTNLVDISIKLGDPVLAAKAANAIAEAYIEQYKSDMLIFAKEIAQKFATEEFKNEEEAEAAFEGLADLFGVGRWSEISRLRSRRFELENELDAISLYYKGGHPEIIAIKKSIEELGAQTREEIKKKIDSLQGSLDSSIFLERVRIVERAETPKVPVGPKRVRGVLFLTFLGLIGGCGLAYFLYQLDPSIKTEEEMISETGLVCLGSVPKEGPEMSFLPFSELPPHVKDAFASLRTAILFSVAPDRSKVLLFTSSLRYDGKTTLTSHLASSFALDGHKTVLVDADVRKPRIHRQFGLDKSPGLTNFLNDEAHLGAILFESGTKNLTIIPAGDSVSSSSELLSSGRAGDLFNALREKFDKVLIDTTPLLNIPDAMVLSPLADAIILVINAENSSKKLLTRIIRELAHVNGKVVGGILNRCDLTKRAYYLSQFYHYQKLHYYPER